MGDRSEFSVEAWEFVAEVFRFVQICLELSGLFQFQTGLIRFSLDQSRSAQNFGVGSVWGPVA